jgi:hypothetical protein
MVTYLFFTSFSSLKVERYRDLGKLLSKKPTAFLAGQASGLAAVVQGDAHA